MLDRAARLMWEYDCGAVPIVDERGHTVGMITDRDICMAAYIQGKPLTMLPVIGVGASRVHAIRPDAPIEEAHHLMKMHRVRRLPVIDIGEHLVGMVSVADLVRHARGSAPPGDAEHVATVASVLGEVFRPALLAAR
jgi:CBS domain-containing protein